MKQSILIGPKKALPEGVMPKNLILIGDCLNNCCGKLKSISLGGCPPAEPYTPFAFLDGKDYLRGYRHV